MRAPHSIGEISKLFHNVCILKKKGAREVIHLQLSFLILREGEKWSRLRKALAPKMLRPKGIRENLDNFNGVARDAITHMAALRGIGDEIPDLEGELSKYATECKS